MPEGAEPERLTVVQDGRAKAYRPLPPDAIERAVAQGVAAYREGRFFEAHELLEPAWMGTADIPRRELYQGLIKLAAAFVHLTRGNPRGVAKNLAGARLRLDRAMVGGADDEGFDLPGLVSAIDDRIAALAAGQPVEAIRPIELLRR